MLNNLETHYWKTEESHFDNTETMSDYINFEMPNNWDVSLYDGTYCEVMTDEDVLIGVHASGNGDSFNHKVEFEIIEGKLV